MDLTFKKHFSKNLVKPDSKICKKNTTIIMKKFYSLILFTFLGHSLWAQLPTSIEVDTAWTPTTVVMPPSPLQMQVLFIGGVHKVQTTATYGNPAGEAVAKQWHDFIGFTPDNNSSDLGWVSVNHEMIVQNDSIGDGGGMTVFKIRRNTTTDSIEIVSQTLSDGRTGDFFNVDFANTTGETGMNCGGIASIVDGRIWTAEEWFRTDNTTIADRDTSDFIIGTGTINGNASPAGFPGFNGDTIAKYQNYNYMVEIDPREAVAIRKQYNWGRQGFEGGVVMPDNQTVYLGEDGTPGWFSRFVANTPGDFTSGTLSVYKHDASGANWVTIDNTDLDKMLNYKDEAVAAGATMFNRVEWVTMDQNSGKVYFTETGRDNPGSSWIDENGAGAVHAPHHISRATAQGTSPDSSDYADYYGRIMVYDPATDEVTVFLEGGPDQADPPAGPYPYRALSNPDGLSVFYNQGNSYLLIQEDLNGTSHGRVPAGVLNRTCEMYILYLGIQNPVLDDMRRISIVPVGAEITGAIGTPDGQTILVNSQHPSSSNPYPFNNSLTYAITGWDGVLSDLERFEPGNESFGLHPNPTTREVFLNEPTDVAIYNLEGKRMKVLRNVKYVDVSDLQSGTYFIRNAEGNTKKLIIK